MDYREKSFKQYSGKSDNRLGEVTAVDITAECDLLVSGYQSGDIILWDVAKVKKLKLVE